MKAVIVAAGLGIRLGSLAEQLPKGLLEVGGESLLERSLASLGANGIGEAVIVVGYLAELMRDTLGSECCGVKLRYVNNPRFEETGSMYSLSLAAPLVDDDVLLLESDLLYDPVAISRLLDDSRSDVILASEPTGLGDDVYLCTEPDCRLTLVGKKLAPADRERAVGALVGISKLSRRFLAHLFDVAERDYAAGRERRHYEECIATATDADYPTYVDVCPGLIWTEVDTEADLRRARDTVYPMLRARSDETGPGNPSRETSRRTRVRPRSATR